MSCGCKEGGYTASCGCTSNRCCKKDKMSYTELMSTIATCDGTSGEVLVYNDGTYCKVDLATIFGGSTLTGDSLSVTGDGDIGGDLDVNGTTTLDDVTVEGDADFSGTVDFTGATLIFDDGELCDEISRCVMNDADVISAIEAVASGATSGFGCTDVASCIGSHAATQSAIESIISDYLSDNGYTPGGATGGSITTLNGAIGAGAVTGNTISVPNSCGGTPSAIQVVTYARGQGGTVASTSTWTPTGTSGVYFDSSTGSNNDVGITSNIMEFVSSSGSWSGSVNAAGTLITLDGVVPVNTTYQITVFC